MSACVAVAAIAAATASGVSLGLVAAVALLCCVMKALVVTPETYRLPSFSNPHWVGSPTPPPPPPPPPHHLHHPATCVCVRARVQPCAACAHPPGRSPA